MKKKLERGIVMPFRDGPEGSAFEYCFTTTFEDTNVVGNIYFANYARWQGKCREMFLKEYCPEVADEIKDGLALITLDLSLRFIGQLFAFQDVIIRMRLGSISGSRMQMLFSYFRSDPTGDELVCEGSQAMACMRAGQDGRMEPVAIPPIILEVFEQFGVAPVLA
jgi:enediyne biosynthesis thioesterase